MLLPKKNRLAVYSYLFKEGVMVAPKDTIKPKHDDVDVPNLHVIKLMQSLKSRGYVKESFAWMWYYWYLTDEGIEYLREYLHLPAEVIPATLKKQQPSRPARPAGGPSQDRFNGEGGDRKSMGAGRDFKPSFGRGGGGDSGFRSREGGFGRGSA